jgi:hypothetical protein
VNGEISESADGEGGLVAWVGGLAHAVKDETLYISVAFTWRLREARELAIRARFLNQHVVIGGPALFRPDMQAVVSDVAEIQKNLPDAVVLHNPDATIASRGCPVGCYFCIVPKMEGLTFTLLPDFPVRPILCDNNLSALPWHYQVHIVNRYHEECVPLMDANSGFEPKTFTEDVYQLWKPINRGPWRFAFDEMGEMEDVRRVMKMLQAESSKRKRVYVLIGNEPFAECMERIRIVLDGGCEPHVQPYIKLMALEREPFVQHDWTAQKLIDVARWANRFLWKYTPFEQYDRYRRTITDRYDEQQGLFV